MIKRHLVRFFIFLLFCALQSFGMFLVGLTAFLLWTTFFQGKPLPIVQTLCAIIGAAVMRGSWKMAGEETESLLADDN